MPVPRLMTSAHICRRSGGTARPKSVRSSGRLWFDPQPALHDGMKAGIVLDSADLQQHERSRALRRHDHVEIAISGGRGVCDHVVIDPFDGVADFGPRIGRPEHQIFHQDADRSCMRGDGGCSDYERGGDQPRKRFPQNTRANWQTQRCRSAMN